jgi:type IV pilus assembly protein PilC
MTSGQVEAEHEALAAEQLRRLGYVVVEIKEKRPSLVQSLVKPRSAKVGLGEVTLLSRQLAAMLDAGIPLTRSLFSVGRQTRNTALQAAVNDVARNVEGGVSFSEALSAYPKIFGDLYVSMIRAGEIGGSLNEVLTRLSDQLERDKNLRDNLRSATFYPITVMSFAVLVMLAMLFFIVPVFVGFFPAGVTLPAPTRVIVALSDSLRHQWYVWLFVAGGLGLGLRFFVRSPAGGRAWERVRFRIPVFGPLFHRAVVARFARTFSTLLAGGIPVLQALETAGPAAGSTQVAEAVAAAGLKIEEGKSLAGPLEESGIFPPMVVDMVVVGEETGALPALLSRVAEFFEAEVATMTKGLTAMLEPLMLIFVGIIVAVMVISLYLPIFIAVLGAGGN